MQIEYRKIDELIPYVNNPRNNENSVDAVASSIKNFGFKVPIVVDIKNEIINGHTRLKAAKKIGLEEVPVIVAEDLSEAQIKAFRIADNRVAEFSEWDDELLLSELQALQDLDFDISEFDFDMFDFDSENLNDKTDETEKRPLSETFVIPPFSILDTRQGEWQARVKSWKALGIKSETGREEELTFSSSLNNFDGHERTATTSIFDPVLTEIIYRWFTPKSNSEIIDPFAGGSVRGVVAGKLGHKYTGVDLRQEQVDANYANAAEIGIDGVTWHCDDSLNIDKYAEDGTNDLLIACPPYFDLEVYSDDEKDISNMSFEEFDLAYTEIMRKTARKLKDNRFAVVVISDIRDGKTGAYRDLTGMTKRALAQEGFMFYNDIILVNAVGTAAIRARKYMLNRKVARSHQNVLIFYKGDHKEIKNHFPELTEFEDVVFGSEG